MTLILRSMALQVGAWLTASLVFDMSSRDIPTGFLYFPCFFVCWCCVIIDAQATICETIADYATDTACFGWAQHTVRGTVVGEARCAKSSAPVLKEKIGSLTNDMPNGLVIKDYKNTKIKLHFSHFKILPDDRETCFRDVPHQCLQFQVEEGDEVKAAISEEDRIPQQHLKEELHSDEL
uniref:Uncharacterized protein n=1 Tax=Octactis speculum TaxID=3111310 RepID=A0A7S2CNR4_9STRA|mmetsp:Transcript_38211/g.51720  ORF Transcript_38211/g.51720 Transcript_38211/m.51720 type:complete len:179 (+) Transcript_38211:55-591(+)